MFERYHIPGITRRHDRHPKGGNGGFWPTTPDPYPGRTTENESRLSGMSILTTQPQLTFHKLSREVLDIAASHIRPGITTDELDEIVHNETIQRNAYPSPLGYRSFPKSVCTYVSPYINPLHSLSSRSVNEVICHGIPDQRKLKTGDIINIGLSAYL